MVKGVIWFVVSCRNSLVCLVLCVLSWTRLLRIKHKASSCLSGEEGQKF